MKTTYEKALAKAVAARRRSQRRALEQTKTQEALSPQLFELGDLLNLPAGAKRITSPENRRDLSPLMQERMQDVCYFLAVTTPFGKGIVEVITDYVVGEGFKLAAEDPDVQAVLDRFWKDPVNRMDENIGAWCKELLIFGELCPPVAVNPVNGLVRLGYVDPQEIDAVEFGSLVTGENRSELSVPVAVRLKTRLGEREGRRLEIVHADEELASPSFGRMAGECFYFAINKAKSASRGISELFNLADWVDMFDQMIFDFGDKVRFLNAFVWHYIVKGADEATVKKWKKEVVKSPPRQGGVQVTNDQVEIKAQTPQLQGSEMHESARMVKLYGLGGLRLPAWFFGDPIDANRAVAEVMEGPAGKMLTNRQNVLKAAVRGVADFQLSQAVEHGVLSPNADLGYKVQVPDLSVKDMQKAGTTLQTAGNALALAEDRGWIRKETAARSFHTVLTQLGTEVDSKQEFEKAQEEKLSGDAKEINALAPQKNLADALAKMKAAGMTQ